VTGEEYRPKNVAAVFVTATLPPFARAGSRVDVTVSAIGDAKSLLGGTLVMTPLNGADGEIYAVAQGTIIAGGVAAEGDASRVVQGVPTAGTLPSGARVEREVAFDFSSVTTLRLALKSADFTTAARIEAAINENFGTRIATMLDSGTVALDLDRAGMRSPAHAISRIEGILVQPETRARVVVDQRSGTIVMGADVRISRVAVAQGCGSRKARWSCSPTPLPRAKPWWCRGPRPRSPRTAPGWPKCRAAPLCPRWWPG